MVNLSEEEIIKIIKEKVILDYNCYNSIDKIELEAIQGLLDLYNKEKEKNKNLLLQLKDSENELLEVTNNIISTDEIGEKIKELEKNKNTEVNIFSHDFFTLERTIKVLEELLEEE